MDTLADFAERNPGLEPAETLRRYSDQTKLDMLRSNSWDEGLASEIDRELLQFGADNGLDPEAVAKRPEPQDNPALVARAFADKDPALADAARQFAASQSDHVRSSFADPKAYEDSVASYRKTYEDLATPEVRNTAKREALRSGELPFAVIDGALEMSPSIREVLGNDEALARMFDANPDLDRSLIPAVKQKLATAPGYDVPSFELDRQSDFYGMVQGAVGKDPELAMKMQSLVTAFEKDGNMLDFSDGVNSGPIIDQMATALSTQGDFTPEEAKNYLKDFAQTMAAPPLKDSEDVDANVTKLSTGQRVLPMGVMLNKELFDRTMKESKTIPEEQKKALIASRNQRIEAFAPDAFATIGANRGEFWQFKTERTEAGKTNTEILDEWMSDPENHSSVRDFAGGIGESVIEGFGGLVLYPMALAGDENARYAIEKLQKSDSERRAYARLFGKNLGAGYDLSRLIAPVAADVSVSLLTAGAGASLVAGKSGVKAALKSTLRNSLTAESKSALREFTLNAARRGGARGVQGVDEVLTFAGRDIASKLTTTATTASYLSTAFNRSAGSTYVQLHTQLTDSGKYTPEQVREIALNHGLIAGTMTAAVTGGFSMLGHAGMEGIYNGITRKQLGGIYDRMSTNFAKLSPEVRAGISMESPEKMLESIIRKSLGPIWRGAAKPVLDEGAEEGIDQILQYVNQQIATGEKINVVDAVKEGAYAAMLGGVMGGTVAGVNSMVRGADVSQNREIRELLDTAQKLDKANAPQTAAVLRRMAMQVVTGEGTVTDVDGQPVSTEAPDLPIPEGFTNENDTNPAPANGQDTGNDGTDSQPATVAATDGEVPVGPGQQDPGVQGEEVAGTPAAATPPTTGNTSAAAQAGKVSYMDAVASLKTKGVDVKTLSREDFADAMASEGHAISDSQLRKSRSLRDTEGRIGKLDLKHLTQPLSDLADSVKSGAKKIAGIRFGDETAGWVHYHVGSGTRTSSGAKVSNQTPKTYITIKEGSLSKAFSPTTMSAFLSKLGASGINGQVKHAASGTALASFDDQIVFHGATRADADAAAKLAEQFFGSDLEQTTVGVDAQWGSYSQVVEARANVKARGGFTVGRGKLIMAEYKAKMDKAVADGELQGRWVPSATFVGDMDFVATGVLDSNSGNMVVGASTTSSAPSATSPIPPNATTPNLETPTSPAPVTPTPEEVIPEGVPEAGNVEAPSEGAVGGSETLTPNDRQQRIQSIKVGNTQSAFQLATIAKQEGVDLTTMSREEYVAYAKQQGIRLSDQTLREQPSLRSATSMAEILAQRKALNPQTAEDIKADKDFAVFADSVKNLAEGKGTQHNGEIATGVTVRSGTKNSSSWLFFGIGKGAGTDANGDTHKSYIGFKNHYKSLTPARFVAFMSALKAAGFNGDVKSMQDLASQRALSDQIVMHGNSKTDADLALQVAESFFGGELSFKDIGVDNKTGGSHSQILANQLSADLDTELNATPTIPSPTQGTPEASLPKDTPASGQPGVGETRTFYRGTTPGDSRRIAEPFSAAKGMTFVARKPESAKVYGESVEEIITKPGAKILSEEDPAFWKLLGRRKPANGSVFSAGRKGEKLTDVVNDAITKAKDAGYDILSFTSDTDIGTIILNENAVTRKASPTPNTNEQNPQGTPGQETPAEAAQTQAAVEGGQETGEAGGAGSGGTIQGSTESLPASSQPDGADRGVVNPTRGTDVAASERVGAMLQEQMTSSWIESQPDKILAQDIVGLDSGKIKKDVERSRRGVTDETVNVAIDSALERRAITPRQHEILKTRMGYTNETKYNNIRGNQTTGGTSQGITSTGGVATGGAGQGTSVPAGQASDTNRALQADRRASEQGESRVGESASGIPGRIDPGNAGGTLAPRRVTFTSPVPGAPAQGTVESVDPKTGKALIVGDDGKRYPNSTITDEPVTEPLSEIDTDDIFNGPKPPPPTLAERGIITEGLTESNAAVLSQTAPGNDSHRKALAGHDTSSPAALLASLGKTGPAKWKPLVKLLQSFDWNGVTLTLINDNIPVTVEGRQTTIGGVWIRETGQILIAPDSSIAGTIETVLHEMVHAATEQSFANPTEAQTKVLKRIGKMREALLKRAGDDANLRYGLSNDSEFFSHMFTSDSFRASVDALTKKGETSRLKLLWDAITELLLGRKKIAGVNSDLIADLMTFVKEGDPVLGIVRGPEARMSVVPNAEAADNLEWWLSAMGKVEGHNTKSRAHNKLVIEGTEKKGTHAYSTINRPPSQIAMGRGRAYDEQGILVTDGVLNFDEQKSLQVIPVTTEAITSTANELFAAGFELENDGKTYLVTPSTTSDSLRVTSLDDNGPTGHIHLDNRWFADDLRKHLVGAKVFAPSPSARFSPTPEFAKSIAPAGTDLSNLDFTEIAKELEGVKPVVAEDIMHALVNREIGHAAGMRMSPAPAEPQIRKEIKKYVTGNWPSDPAGRLEELTRFTKQWSGRFEKLFPVLRESDGYPETPSTSLQSISRDAAAGYIEHDGSVAIYIGQGNIRAIAENPEFQEYSETEAKSAIALMLQEELYHAAYYESVRRSKPEGMTTAAAVRADIVSIADGIRSAAGKPELTKKLNDALYASAAIYSPEKVPKVEGIEGVVEFVMQMDEKGKRSTIMEFMRQVIQLRKDGDLTENGLQRLIKTVKQWFEKQLTALREIAGRPEAAGLPFADAIKNTEDIIAELDKPDIRFSPVPETRLRSTLDAATTGNPSVSDRAYFITHPEERATLTAYLKGAANAMWDRLKLRFDTRSAVYADRLVAEVARAESGYRIRNVRESFDPDNVRMSVVPENGDAEYLAAVESGDMETAQRMVDEAARAVGYGNPDIFSDDYQYELETKRVSEISRKINITRGNVERAQAAVDMGLEGVKGRIAEKSLLRNKAELERLMNELITPPIALFHGRHTPWTKYERRGTRSIWAVNDQRVADTYGRDVVKLYMRLDNPMIFDAENATFKDLEFEGERLDADDLSAIAAERGYDGLVIQRFFDSNTDDGGDVVAHHFTAFNPEQIKSADPVTRDDAGNVIPLSQRFQSTSPDIRFSPTPHTDENGDLTFKHTGFVFANDGNKLYVSTDEDVNENPGWWTRMFARRDDMRKPLSAIKVDTTAQGNVIQSKFKRLDPLYKKGVKKEGTDEAMMHVGQAIGSTAPMLTPDEETRINDELEQRLTDASNAEEQNAAFDWARDEKTASMVKQAEELRRLSGKSLEWLEGNAPMLHEWAKEIRETTNEFQDILADWYKDSRPELSWTIDNSRGVYLVRSYRFHQDPAMGEMVLSDPKFGELRDRVTELFAKDLAETEFQKLRKQEEYANTPEATLRAAARKNVEEKARAMFHDYVIGHEFDASSVNVGGIKTEFQRFMRKKNLDPLISELLGEIEDPHYNAVRTLSAVSGILFNQKMLTAIKDDGVQAGTIITESQKDSDPKYRNWKPLVAQNVHSQAYAPLAGYYAKPEDVEALQAAFGFGRRNAQDTADKSMDAVNRMILGAAGYSLMTMTLGSVGYQVRNVFGGVIMAMAQGVNVFSADYLKSANVARGNAYHTRKGDIEFRERLIALRVIGDGTQIEYLRELRDRFKANPVGALQWATEQGMKISPKMVEAAAKGKMGIDKMVEFLEQTAEFTETAHNVAVFIHELNALWESGLYKTVAEAEQEAARRVKMVTASKSEKSQALDKFSQQSWSALVAPFARFKAEMVRTTVNTYRLGLADLRSDNPRLKAHGIQRLASAAFIHGVVTVTLPLILQQIADFDDEEYKALQAALPSYSRNSQFWLKRLDDGSIRMLDLTYTNPFSYVFDIVPQIIRSRHDPLELPSVIANHIAGEMIGENIVAGSLLDVSRNRDEQTGNTLWLETDDFSTKVAKGTIHVLESSYTPAVAKKMHQAYQASQRPAKEDEDFYYTPLGIMVGMAMPAKPYDRKVEDMAYRAFRNLGRQNRELWQITSPLSSKAGMGEGTPTEIYAERVRAATKVWGNAHSFAKSYQAMGMSKAKVLSAMTEAGLSRKRAAMAMRGFAERPVLSADKLRDIREIDENRYQEFVNAMRSQPRIIDVR